MILVVISLLALIPLISGAAQSDRTIRVKFKRGSSSTVIRDSVIRGTRDHYLTGARAGQTMTVNISSTERNAVFDLQTPGGAVLAQEETSWRGKLPASGDYMISVGGTRGNASYTLRISIR